MHLLLSPHPGSQLHGQQRNHPHGSSLPAPLPGLWLGCVEVPRVLPAPAPAIPCHVPMLLAERMLLALASDVTLDKSPDPRQWACATCVWRGMFSSFLWRLKLEAIMCLGFFIPRQRCPAKREQEMLRSGPCGPRERSGAASTAPGVVFASG